MIEVFEPGCEIHHVIRPHAALAACSISTDALRRRSNSFSIARLEEIAKGRNPVQSTRRATTGLCLWLSKIMNLLAQGAVPTEAYERLVDDLLLVIDEALGPVSVNHVIKPRSRYLLARRAHEYMLERLPNPPTVTEICTFIGTSERNLHLAFTEVFSVSPKRFLKTRRLFAAREALKKTRPCERVCNIALSLGFWDLGYFARDYKAMFGELPSATLRREY